jgi:hypothetical protein
VDLLGLDHFTQALPASLLVHGRPSRPRALSGNMRTGALTCLNDGFSITGRRQQRRDPVARLVPKC